MSCLHRAGLSQCGQAERQVIQLLAYRYDPIHTEHLLVLPLLPRTLRQWLDHDPLLDEIDRTLVDDPQVRAPTRETEAFSTRCMTITRQLMNALEHLHRHGTAHRDVKPENIMLDDQDGVVLIDFATAWVADETQGGDMISGGFEFEVDEEAGMESLAQVEVGTG